MNLKKKFPKNAKWHMIVNHVGDSKGKDIDLGWHSSADAAVTAFANWRKANPGPYNFILLHKNFVIRLGIN